MIKQVHPNSIESYYTLDDKAVRQNMVLNVYKNAYPKSLTDREVANKLGFDDMNKARPRISELKEDKFLKECGKIKCPITNKKVRTIRFVPDWERIKSTVEPNGQRSFL